MTRRLVAMLAAAAAAVALWAGPAGAHMNDAAGKGVGPPDGRPVAEQGLGHAGMECGAELEQTPLVPLGLSCPANR